MVKDDKAFIQLLEIMKKTFLFLVGMFFSVMAQAYTAVTFKAGDPSCLLRKTTTTFEVDYSKLRVTNYDNLGWDAYLQRRGNDFVRDWPSDRRKAESYFTIRFNRKSDFLRITEGSADYKMVLRIATIDVGNAAGAFNPWASAKAGGAILNGTIEMYDARTNNLLCVLNVIDAKGAGTPSETTRLGLMFSEAAGDLCDFIEDDVERGRIQPTSLGGVAAAAAVTTTAPVASAPQTSAPVASAPQASAPAATSQASAGKATITLKNGAVVTGDIKKFDPLKEIVIVVAGHETTIPMSEVKDVTTVSNGAAAPTPAPTAATVVTPTTQMGAIDNGGTYSNDEYLGGRKLLVTDRQPYPASIRINLGTHNINLLLVRGGKMNMGYDGDGSRKMHSEPVHEVNVTSFYISDQPLPASLVLQYVSDKNVDGRGNEPAQVRGYDDVEQVIAAIARQTGKPYRLPTEAEWEYAASGDLQNQLFSIASSRYTAYEWCSDWLDNFPEDRMVLTDPTGPIRGEQHVIRSFNCDRGKYDRSSNIDEDDAFLGLVRLVIKAKDIQ